MSSKQRGGGRGRPGPAAGGPLTAYRFRLAARVLRPLPLALLITCSGVSPLRNLATVGRDPYAVFVADDPGGRPDLFAVRADGGPVVQITFTTVAEAHPVLSPDGSAVAFLRARSTADSVPGAIWVQNLVTGGERQLALPPGAGPPDRLGWAPDGGTLYAGAGAEVFALPAPPASGSARPVGAAERAAAESSFSVLVGDPPFGRVVGCGRALCVEGHGPPVPFAQDARSPARWGPDSVGYFTGDELVVRPVGPGRARRVAWTRVPPRPRDLTFFPGRPRS